MKERTDAELINELEARSDKRMVWCCRWSTTDCGLRIHEIPIATAKTASYATAPTMREAIDLFLDAEESES